MKFTYNTKPAEHECVAYIDGEGDLIIRYNYDRKVFFHIDDLFNIYNATHRFYPGDSITITFE